MVTRSAPPALAKDKLLDRASLVKKVGSLKDNGKRVVFTNGCFDILHLGHIQLLESARALGDILVVGINADSSVRKLGKGDGRPINRQEERAHLIAALACVDYVTVFREDTPITLLKLLKPHVHVKGGDYKAEKLPEYKTVKALGGEVSIVPLVKGKSTTDTFKRVVANISKA